MAVAPDPRKTGFASARQLLAASAVAVSHTGNTNETALVTIPIPAGAPGLNGGLEIYTGWGFTGNADTKTIRVRLGGIGGTAFLARSITAASNSTEDIRRIRNRGAANSQMSAIAATALPFTAGTGAVTTGAIDTSVAQDLVISIQLTNATDTGRLNSYEVWLVP